MSFPTKLKELRQARGLTQEQLAKLIGVNLRTYKRYEEGRTTPRIAIYKRIVIALETTSDELLELK
jgi:transcriptional regulator with XRE-family HTH domain